jgi:hypothetical protein
MDANDLTPEDRDLLARALRNPATRLVLELLGPLDLQSTLCVARDLHPVQHNRQQDVRLVPREQEARVIRTLRGALSRPGALDRLRDRRAEPAARFLLLCAYRLGVMDVPP